MRYVDMSTRGTAQVLRLINDLLELDRIEAGMMPFAKERVDCSELVRASGPAGRNGR